LHVADAGPRAQALQHGGRRGAPSASLFERLNFLRRDEADGNRATLD
jgi:hypothetical protein